jgi:MFS family permease
MTSTQKKNFFYIGSMINSIGNLTIVACLSGFLIKFGFSDAYIGCLIGLTRIIPLTLALFTSSWIDRLNSKILITICDLMGIIGSLGALLYWTSFEKNELLLFLFLLIRSTGLSISVAIISKVSKEFSDSDQKSLQHAIWLNLATNGATLFAGAMGWYSLKFLDFSYILALDILSFVLNILIFVLTAPAHFKRSYDQSRKKDHNPIMILYRHAKTDATLDLILAFSMGCLALSTTRLFHEQTYYIPVAVSVFGLGFWTSGYFLKKFPVKHTYLFGWGSLAAIFLLFSFSWIHTFPLFKILLGALRDFFYALLFTKHLHNIQKKLPIHIAAQGNVGRILQSSVILAIMEIFLGIFSEMFSHRVEFLTRFLFAMIGLISTLKLDPAKNFLKSQVAVLLIVSPIIFSNSTYGKERNVYRQFSSSDLRIAIPQSLIQLDPGKMEDAYSMAINLQIFRGLFRYSPSGEIFPDLVDKWTVAPSGTEYLFTLKKRSFSNGDQIKAHHVLHSLARLFYLKSSISADLMAIKGAKAFIESKKIEDLAIKADSDYSV